MFFINQFRSKNFISFIFNAYRNNVKVIDPQKSKKYMSIEKNMIIKINIGYISPDVSKIGQALST